MEQSQLDSDNYVMVSPFINYVWHFSAALSCYLLANNNSNICVISIIGCYIYFCYSLLNVLFLLYIFNVLHVSLACRYLSSLILVEGMDIDFLQKCALEDCTEQHQFSSAPGIIKV